ncbi:MAG: ABC transporter permease [Gammaproteobacteria bacterium]|nr:ABC transporter permease [Gammaproteobacteria bacterium]
MNIALRLAWRNIWRQPRRTWLTISAMVFSNIILIFMLSLQFGMYAMMIDNTLALFTGHLQVQAPGYKDDKKMRQSIPDAVVLGSGLRQNLESSAVAVRAMAFALASSEERSFGIQVIGVQPQHEVQVSSLPGLLSKGRYLTQAGTDEVVIGSVLARNLRVSVGDELTLIGTGRDGSFAAAVVNVTGILESGMTDLDRSIAQIPLAAFQDIFSMGTDAHEVVITTADLSMVEETKKAATGLLPAGSNLVVYDWDALQPGLKQAIQADLASAWFMYTVLIILVAFSVLNTVLMSVLERTREFGIVMSLGLTAGRLGRLVMLETTLMGGIGLLLGLLLGGGLVIWLGIHGFSYPGMEQMADRFNIPSHIYPQLELIPVLIGPLLVFASSLLASVYPAARLHWLQPVQAMRVA